MVVVMMYMHTCVYVCIYGGWGSLRGGVRGWDKAWMPPPTPPLKTQTHTHTQYLRLGLQRVRNGLRHVHGGIRERAELVGRLPPQPPQLPLEVAVLFFFGCWVLVDFVMGLMWGVM